MSGRRKRDWDEPGSPGPGGEGERRRESRPDLGPLARMSGRALRRLIERVDMDTLSLALRYAEDALIQRVLRNVSSRTAAALREEMEGGPGAAPEDCAEAQQVLLEVAYDLEERGEISFEGPADDALPPLDRELEHRIAGFSLAGASAPDVIALVAGLAARGREHGLVSLEPALERVPEGLLAAGLRMAVDQLPVEEIEAVLGRQIDASIHALERNAEIAVEGVLSILEGEDEERTRARLVSFLPEGEADFERMPEVKLIPSAQAANDIIRASCELAALARREGLGALEERAEALPHPLLARGVRLALEGSDLDEVERMLRRRSRTRAERERRKLETLLEGLLLLREGRDPAYVREALEGFLEDKA